MASHGFLSTYISFWLHGLPLLFLAGISISMFSETMYCIAGSFWKDNFLEILENGDGFQNYTSEIVLTLYIGLSVFKKDFPYNILSQE